MKYKLINESKFNTAICIVTIKFSKVDFLTDITYIFLFSIVFEKLPNGSGY